jgi:hypothetical protein
MDRVIEGFVTIAGLIAAIAIIALLVSPKATTSQVIQSIASGYGNNVAVAISPVTGTNVSPNLSYPSSGGFGMPSFSMGMPSLS